MEKVRYSYREGKEKYTAEEWITDKYALNKAQTKLVRGLAKWRRKTVDFVDDLAAGVAEALSATTAKEAPVKEKKVEKAVVNSGPIVITPKKQVTVEAPKAAENAAAAKSQAVTVVVPATPITPATPVEPAEKAVPAETVTPAPVAVAAPAATSQTQGYKEVTPAQLSADVIQTGAGKLVIVIGEEPFNMTMMTANAGGSLGKVSGKPVIFSILSPDQPYEQMEKAENYTIRFYPTGKTEPTVILECKKLPSPAAMEGMPRTYVGEILKAMVK